MIDRSLRDGLTRREWLWYGVTGLLFVILLYFADLGEFLVSLRDADLSLFLVALGVGFSSLLVWAWVWHRFFDKLGIPATVSQTIRMFLTGHFLNSITPLGQFGGEPIMAYIISESTGTDYERALTSVVSSDIINAAPFFTFTLGGILYLSVITTLSEFLFRIGVIAAVILTVGGIGAYLLWSDTKTLGGTVIGVVDWIERRIGRGERLFESIRESILEVETIFHEAGNDRIFLLETVLISHLAIVAQIISLYFVFLSMGIEPRFVPIYFIVTLSTIATLSPTPGGSGTYEAAFSGLMTIFYSVRLATALTAAVLFRLTTYWPGLVVGYIAMLTLNSAETDETVDEDGENIESDDHTLHDNETTANRE
ncbi:hypothetical protein halTADL_0190 [Halohasta litchfieldiae]|uniref:Lysylphosphatidylglycerol synthase TM region n=1 Tax=Halohasta litchfieldiae TaxID=1073996 RepID=A0A1H6T7W8_9EURY|nr:lysylphosphatidylglycerol synthase transmembrane domain-containing protein [Halohasta litchfieldiae]ATW87012.1 hypothetical protein halTADL_0190 [Halohasta litchfieldiae]SEI72380.1 hypothetical protein SAMN05444271_106120 [Halohasta litchfieldiae]